MRIAVGCVLMLGLTGCTTYRTALEKEELDKIQQTHVRIHVPQDELKAKFVREHPSPPTSGAAGGVVAMVEIIVIPIVNATKAESAHDRVEPLREVTTDLDVRGLLWQTLSNTISTNLPARAWLKPGRIETLATYPRKVKDKELAKSSRLDIECRYMLSPDCRVFFTTTKMAFHPPGRSSRALAANLIHHYSEPLPACKREEAISLWCTNNGAAFRTAFAESLAANAHMLSYALQHLGGTPWPRKGQVQVDLLFPPVCEGVLPTTALGKHFINISVLEESPQRVICQSGSGALLSFPRSLTNQAPPPKGTSIITVGEEGN